ncbi:hypothetical protein LXH13_19390 [Streptomyces spinosirectus]|uniref:hypothetical protein n=1 Tax=Streptomyces spinosirectus TaxID=2906474 RepID=UPI001F1C4EA7|nr:hypothetical protein [Streptomyces spinosirectus]UIR19082.1 hypothetical protein LXH13_19390 [Streptomyces spinosirectus]
MSQSATARDVTEAFNELMRDAADPAEQGAYRERFMRFLWTLTTTYFFLGSGIFIASVWDRKMEFRDYSLTFSGALMGTIVTMVLLRLQKPILQFLVRSPGLYRNPPPVRGERGSRAGLIIRWMEIEETMHARLSDEIGESRVPKDPRSLMDQFSRAANLSPVDKADLRFVLQVRNQAAHMRDVEPSEIAKAAHKAGRLLEKFRTVNLTVR